MENNDNFGSTLISTGGLDIINQAIDLCSKTDVATIVRAATEALRRTEQIPIDLTVVKSSEMSNDFRKQGNIHYVNKKYELAIKSYIVALTYAPMNSIELTLAYGNMSAALLAINAFRECLQNIAEALKSDCPDSLRVKLEKRKTEANKHLMPQMMNEILLSSEKDIVDYLKFDIKRHDSIPCASIDVLIDDDKRIVSAADIKSGTVVAYEPAYVSLPEKGYEYNCCYYCHSMCFFFVTCEGCCVALFCGEECRKKCMEEYHRIECHIVACTATFEIAEKLAIRAAIKMSLKLSWEQLRLASLEMGENRLKRSSVAEAFDCNVPTSILCYNDDVPVTRNEMIIGSLECAKVMHIIEKIPHYMPEATKDRERAYDSLSRIMLHLVTTFRRKVDLPSASFDYLVQTFKYNSQQNTGWFSFTSKLAHSCEPNLFVLGLNNSLALIAIRSIKKGEQLTICYTEHFYDIVWTVPFLNAGELRQKLVYNSIRYNCECRVCVLGWKGDNQVKGNLTQSQERAYNAYKRNINNDFAARWKGICVALDKLSGCINTTEHKEVYTDMRRTMNMLQNAKTRNKGYKCRSNQSFAIIPPKTVLK